MLRDQRLAVTLRVDPQRAPGLADALLAGWLGKRAAGAGGLLGQAEGIADVIRHILDVTGLVIVSQNHRLTLAFQLQDLVFGRTGLEHD